ncbi:3-oxoacyl-[acyl-carrier-protein] reductase [bacterium]|nr:3-oxoacyl-[acyl-carrier-protein] reductase [bacterium]
MLVKDKVIIVTGASRGIGKDIATALAANGATLAICSTKSEVAQSVAKDLADTYSIQAQGWGVDVSDMASVKSFIEEVVKTFGRVDVLINNAGITRDNLLMRMSEEEWQAVLDTNLNSVFYTTKSVIRPMLKQKGGRIVNIASVVGVMGNAGQSNYAASKGGMIAFTKSIAREYGAKGILANTVAPGFVETEMIESLPDDYLNNIISNIPLKRLGKAEEIANLVLFLASDLSGYMTGQVFNIDGGMVMN